MSYIHFKTVYNLNYDKVTFDGSSLTLSQLKKLIADKIKLSKQLDFDLEITNADTNQVYQNDNDVIMKNTRVIVKRVIKSSTAPLRAQSPKISPPQPTTPPRAIQRTPSQASLMPIRQAESPSFISSKTEPAISPPEVPLSKTVYDSLAPLNIPSKPIVYVETIVENKLDSSDSRMDEKAKLESILMSSMTKTQSEQVKFQTQTKITKPSVQQQHQTQIPLQNRPIPPNYLCVICKKPGHLKQLCPEAGLLPKPEERPKFPSGIPKTNLRPAQPGDKFVMLGPEGYVVSEIEHKASKIIKKDKPSFLDEEEFSKEEINLTSSDFDGKKEDVVLSQEQIPADLKCPFGNHLIKDAVLVPCCGHFVCCDECIRQKILNDEVIECPYEKCDQEIESLSSITPFHETRKKVNDYLNELKQQKLASITSQSLTETKTDAFLDLILSDVNGQSRLEQEETSEGSKLEFLTGSPLQDNKISSSEITSQQLINSSQTLVEQTPKTPISAHTPSLLPSPSLSSTLINQDLTSAKSQVYQSQSETSMLTQQQTQYRPAYPYPNLAGYNQSRVRYANQKTNIQIYPPHQPFNYQYMNRAQFFGIQNRQRFIRPGLQPGLMPIQAQPYYPPQVLTSTQSIQQPHVNQLMTEAEFYEYQEKLKKESLEKKEKKEVEKRKTRSRSRSLKKNRSRSRSRSRTRNRNKYRHRSRSRTRRTRSKSRTRRSRYSRSSSRYKRSTRRRSRSRSKSRSKKHKSSKTEKEYSKGEYSKKETNSSNSSTNASSSASSSESSLTTDKLKEKKLTKIKSKSKKKDKK